MRGFTLALLACIFASASADKVAEVQEIVAKCMDNDVKSCKKVEARRSGHADNAFCATFQPEKSTFDTHWAPYCAVSEGCEKKYKPEFQELYHVAMITSQNYIPIMKYMEPEFKSKLGEKGVRRSLMNPAVGGPFACRSWLQFTDTSGRRLYPADSFLYYEIEVAGEKVYECRLTSSVPIVAESKLMSAPKGVPSDVWGDRYCGCENGSEGLGCKKLEADNQLIAICKKTPDNPRCMQIDGTGGIVGADACMVGEHLSGCVFSEELPKSCYNPMSIEMPQYYVDQQVILGTAREVRDYLEQRGSYFEEFAGFVGFTPDGSLDNLGPRPRGLIPEIAGPVACRNLLNLRGALGQSAFPEADAFIWDSTHGRCRFVKYHIVQDPLDVKDALYGEAYCVE